MALVVVGLAAWGRAGEEKPEVKRARAPDELPNYIVRVLRTTNKAQTNRYVPKVYTIKNVNPYDLFRWIRRTAQIEEGGFYFFGQPAEEANRDSVRSGKIVVIVPEYMLPGIDQMMQVIDREGLTSSAGQAFFYVRPRHRHVADVGFCSVVRALAGNSGVVECDTEANMALVYAAPSKVDDVKKYLALADVRPPQVMIETTVYEIYADNESRLGLDYVSWKNGPGRNLFGAGCFREREHISELDNCPVLFDSGTGGTYGLPGHGFRTRGRNCGYFLDVPSAFFDFLVVKGKARVMTAAKLATRNRVPATLAAGDTILYYETRTGPTPRAGLRSPGVALDPNGIDPNFPDNRTVVGTQRPRVLTGETAGIELEILPTIAQNEINLEIETSLVSHTGFDDSGVPQLVERRVSTEVRVRDSQEIILGGYSRDVFVQRADKIPFLGSLPVIGYLFGGDANTSERRRVVIVITPYVIPDAAAMEYEVTNINALLIKSKALREAATRVPESPAGFDQWLLDEER